MFAILWNIFFYTTCLIFPVVGVTIYLKIDLLDFVGFKKSKAEEPVEVLDPREDEEIVSDEIEALTMAELRCGDDLSLAYRSVNCVPSHIAHAPGVATIKKVDLTECGIRLVVSSSDLDGIFNKLPRLLVPPRNLLNLSYFSALETLVLDKNELESLETCPLLPHLQTLWCNNNNISDLGIFLTDVANKCPRLTYLSLMRNPIVPDLEDVDLDIDEDEIIPDADVLDLGTGAWTDPSNQTII